LGRLRELDEVLALLAAADDVAAVPPCTVFPGLLRRPEPGPADDRAQDQALVGAEELLELVRAGAVGESADLVGLVVSVLEVIGQRPDGVRLGGVREDAVSAARA